MNSWGHSAFSTKSKKQNVPNSPNSERGFVLLTVVITITLVAAIALALSYQGASETNIVSGEMQIDQARYAAEAGMAHAKLQLAQNTSCTAYGNLAATPFGPHSYAATVAPVSGSPVSLVATGTQSSGASRSVSRNDVKVFQATTTLILQPDAAIGKDTYVYEWKSAWNYGSASTLAVEDRIAGDHANALFEFDLSTIPAAATILSATFELNQTSPTGSVGGDFAIHKVTKGWKEGAASGGNGSANWTERNPGIPWTTVGGDFAAQAVATISFASGIGSHQWDISGLVQDWVSGASLNDGLAVVPASWGTNAVFASSDNSNAALRPKLTIVYACECGIGGSSGSVILQPGVSGKEAMLRGTKNYGAAPYTWIDTSVPYHSLYEFDLSGLPPGAMVTSALLDIHQSSADAVTVPADLDIHRTTTTWLEGTGTNSGISPPDGATWTSSDGTAAWTSPGGDYDSAVVDSVIVNSTGLAWHQWDATTLVQSWVDGTYPNFGFLLRASSGNLTKLYLDTGEDSDPTVHPKLTVNFSCPCGTTCVAGPGGSPPAGNKLLLVVDNPASLSTQDSDKKSLIESWGYTVSLIDDDAAQSDFDAATAAADVAYVSATVTDTALSTKLVGATIGVVNEDHKLVDEFGFAASQNSNNDTGIEVTNNAHYITSVFPLGPLTIHTGLQPSYALSGTLAPGLESLGDGSGGILHGVAVLEQGATLSAGGTAAGRRVKLPWGGAAFDHALLNNDGQMLMRRAIEWAAGAGAPSKTLLLVAADSTNLVAQESARKTLFESWGYTVNLVDDSAPQTELDAAAAANDVVYVSEEIDHAQLGIKLRNTPTGVVNEEQYLFQEFGFSNARSMQFRSEIDVSDNSHYITSGLPLGLLTVFTSDQPNSMIITPAAGVQTLALLHNAGPGWHPSVATIETGGALYGGGSAAARRVKLPWGGIDVATLNASGQDITKRAIEWATGAGGSPMAAQRLLFVVGNIGGPGPTAAELAHQSLIESWGYTVELIDDGASQTEFDAAVANNDVVFTTNDITASSLNTKLVAAAIGVVTSEDNLSDEFGLSSGIAWESGTSINVDNNTHYITSLVSPGSLTVFSSSESLARLSGSIAPDLVQLASISSEPMLVSIETGGNLFQGGVAAGRRVQLPWGGSGFHPDNLTSDGRMILQRSIEWGAGLGTGGGGGGGSEPPVFGFDTIFGSAQNNVRRKQIATQATLTEDGTVTSITAYMGGVDGKPVRYAIYTDVAGEPGTLVAETANATTTIPMAWLTINLPPTALTAGTYWLAFSLDNNAHDYQYEADGETRYMNRRATQMGFNADWGSSNATYDRKISIYATYTP